MAKYLKRYNARIALQKLRESKAWVAKKYMLLETDEGDLEINKGDEVITVACGFPTTVAPIIQYGAVPVFIDVDIPTYNIKVSDLEKAKSDKTKAPARPKL